MLASALLAEPAIAQDLDRGEELWALCTQCHGEDGGGNSTYLAPAVAGLPQWYAERELGYFRSGVRGTHFDDIGGMRMRPMSLSLRTESDVTAVAAYLASLPRVATEPELAGGDAEKGAQYYLVCATCHGQNGEGNQAPNAPPLAGSSDWYLQTQLHNFKAGIRGADTRDATGMQMRGMAYTLPDDQAILDVLAYIQTLNKD